MKMEITALGIMILSYRKMYHNGGKNEWWHVDIKEKSVAGFSLK